MIVTNARSLMPKMYSLVDQFTELDIAAALVTETWFKKNRTLEDAALTLRMENGLQIISKERPKRRDGSCINGGGVCIIYDKMKVNLKEYPLKKTNHEIVAAIGKVPNVSRKLAIICVYIPPQATANSCKSVMNLINTTVNKMKSSMNNPLIFIGGDFNRRSMAQHVDCFNDIEILETGPTCGGADLDKIATNISEFRTSIRSPLTTLDGLRKSDHSIILFRSKLHTFHAYTVKTITRRRYTEEGMADFKCKLLQVDWMAEFGELEEDVNMLVDKMDETLGNLLDQCFKMTKIKIKSTDSPWMTREVKRKIRRRKKYYAKNGNNIIWQQKRDAVYEAVNKAKKAYLAREEEKLTQPGSNRLAYRAIQNLRSHDKPKTWDIKSLNPKLSDEELSEELAEFFNSISSEFEPLTNHDLPEPDNQPMDWLQPHEVSSRLKGFKKPRSMVDGDIYPPLINDCHDLLAVPLTKIYNLIKARAIWPRKWKKETVTVIPKSETATEYGECRNLSCTPLFSKVMESFLMDAMNKEVKIDQSQYGGLKGCGAEHMLIEAWDKIINILEDNRASVNLISMDFAKAFNRMCHRECLRALERKGASNSTIRLTAAFLTGRTMQVKVGEVLSKPRNINGGSPQGCVSANALFCATVESLQSGHVEEAGTSAERGMLEYAGNKQFTLYAGDTILMDIPSTNEDNSFVIPFRDNGSVLEHDTVVSDPDTNTIEFMPRSYSTPIGTQNCLSKSHYNSTSTLDYTIDTAPGAGRQLARRWWDTDTEEDSEYCQT